MLAQIQIYVFTDFALSPLGFSKSVSSFMRVTYLHSSMLALIVFEPIGENMDCNFPQYYSITNYLVQNQLRNH